MKIFNLLLDFIFPRSEAIQILDDSSPDQIFKISKKCLGQFDSATFSIFNYKDKLVKEMIWQIKFKKQRKWARICGRFLANEIEKRIADSGQRIANSGQKIEGRKFLLIPIPIHQKRREERGFNQCEWLCEEIIKNDKTGRLDYQKDLLIRTKYQVKQSWSSKKERAENMVGVFSVSDPTKIREREIILIDDVVTTGSTIKEGRRTLLESAAKSVLTFTIAR